MRGYVTGQTTLLKGHQLHPRTFEENVYIYPVLSRRSGGISIGVNLNPDKICNMDCVYCQVVRISPLKRLPVDLAVLRRELRSLLTETLSGALFDHPRFQATPPALRRLNDIALSGDGEPTTFKPFHEAVASIVEIKQELGLSDIRIVLITDAGCLHQPHVRRGLALMDAHEGDIWAKLDAGTSAYYERVNRTKIPFDRILTNLKSAASERPIIIQTLFMHLAGQAPSDAEIGAYIARLKDIEREGELKEIHLYTVARTPAEATVTPLDGAQMDAIAARVAPQVRAPVRVFYGA
jgi:wyosine [tRNA(Phe)-imidazoG37] synthetase (radical SAM superfamily)